MRPAAEDGSGALDLVLRHRYLTATALLTVFFAWVASNGDNVLYETVQEVVGASAAHLGIEPGAALEAFVSERTTSFYGDFFLWVNLSALALQAFVTARLLRYGGFGVLLLFLPVLSVVAYSTMAILPTLAVIKLMKVAESSSNYSIHNTARHVLWLPTTAEMKYKAKSAVDTICVRVGDGLAALTVLVGVRMLSASPLRILWLNVALGVAWICVALVIAREHARLSRKEVQIAPR